MPLRSASLDLWLESSAPDTDVQVVLTELRPDGQEVYVQAGWLRASHRREDPARTEPTRPFHTHQAADVATSLLVPGKPELLRVEIRPFGHLFRKDSRLRVSVEAPAAVFGLWGFESLPTPARNVVHHGGDHASVLRLSRLPGHAAPDEARELPHCRSVVRQPCRPDPLGGAS